MCHGAGTTRKPAWMFGVQLEVPSPMSMITARAESPFPSLSGRSLQASVLPEACILYWGLVVTRVGLLVRSGMVVVVVVVVVVGNWLSSRFNHRKTRIRVAGRPTEPTPGVCTWQDRQRQARGTNREKRCGNRRKRGGGGRT
jgi:hypothetical protein